ncbi:hypothetical protein DFP72DRAFT_890585 [Ephemerocybe angulata]|uniref:Endonuclease/exonuclease/phosphatase domain-containing protein n=1 Tax=Ephemerocybe angulata TaxID=980116 RepID=A0A8H6MA75_9AGAR|nr:hypothetical protein DFP72DRAFT_890585 [Tulosesus angulatus]
MSTSEVPEVPEGRPVIRLRSCNIRGKFQRWMKCPEFVEAAGCCEINVFLETRMSKDSMAAEEGIPGFTRHSIERESGESYPGGGVAVFVRDSIQLEKSVLSSPDILVLDSQEMMVVGAYILPSNSVPDDSVGDSYGRLAKLLKLCGEEEKPVVIIGDLNARVGVSVLRESEDKVVSPRGKLLLDSCKETGMQIFNGMFTNSSSFTSHKPGDGKSVVDLAIGNRSAHQLVAAMRIGSQLSMKADDGRTLSTDHSEVFLDLFDPRQSASL